MQTSDVTSAFPPVLAEVILRSASGGSALETPPTSATLSRLKPNEATIRRAREGLEGLGIQVVSEGSISLTIHTLPEVFEQVFHTCLERPPAGAPPNYRATLPIIVPQALRPYVEAVVLPQPAEFHP